MGGPAGSGGSGRIGERNDAPERNDDKLNGESGDRGVYMGERRRGGISRYDGRDTSFTGSSGMGAFSRRALRSVPSDERFMIDCRHERFFSILDFVVGVIGEKGDPGVEGDIGDFSWSYPGPTGGTAGRGLEGGGCRGGPCRLERPFPSAQRRICRMSRRF